MSIRKTVYLHFSQTGTKLVRVKHDKEIWLDNWRPHLPQVHPLFPNHFSTFSFGWQWLAKDMNDPRLTPEKWSVCYAGDTYLTNGHGVDVYRNYVLGSNMDKTDDPGVESLVTGGSLLLVRFDGAKVWVESLDVRGDIPDAEQMLSMPYYTLHATSCDGLQNPRKFHEGELPNGEMLDIVHPFFLNRSRFTDVWTDAWRVEEWKHSWLPDLLTIYSDLSNRRMHD